MKKIIAVLLSIMLAFGIATSAFAVADTTDTTSISSTEVETPSDPPATETDPSAPSPVESKILDILNRIENAIMNFVKEIMSIINQIVGDIQEECEHTGGTATCYQKSRCKKCGALYGEIDSTKHAGGIEVVNADIPPYSCCQGYSGDLVCLGCETTIHYGSIIPAETSHDSKYEFTDLFLNNKCQNCSTILDSLPLSPMKIEYLKTENDIMYFEGFSGNAASSIRVTYTDDNVEKTVAGERDFTIPYPTKNEIITITIVEFAGDDYRQITKSFNTQTKTWVEV